MKRYEEHHSALTRGYVRKGQEIREGYKGKFGVGYTIKRNNPNSSRFCFITYYIEQ
ncbi:MAG: hypothetical protein Q4F24_08025 [Eubacteriales bacterium]|nr:hypothetical protein [Eubacteriales bacterium]